MALPTTSIGFSPTTPAPDAGYQNAIPRGDGGTPLQRESFEVPATGGGATKTASYTAVAADCGKLLSFTGSSALTLTLPAAVPFAAWTLAVQNNTSAALTLSPNGLQIDGSTSSLTLAAGGGLQIQSDGTNYLTERGAGTVTPQQIQQESFIYAADTGTAGAYAVALSPAPTLVAGSIVVFRAANANTGASTLAVNGGSAIPLKKLGSLALASGDIAAGQIVEAIYDGTNFQMMGGSVITSGAPMVYTGSWSSSTSYAVGAVALYNDALYLRLVAGGSAGSRVVQHGEYATSSNAFSTAVSAGNTLVAVVQVLSGYGAPTVPTDTLGTTYTLIGTTSSSGDEVGIFVGVAPASGANTVASTPTAQITKMLLVELASVSTTIDTYSEQYGLSTSTPSATLTTTGANRFIYAASLADSNSMTFAAGTGLTLLGSINGGYSGSVAHAYGFASTAGSHTYGFTLGSGANPNNLYVVAFTGVGSTPDTDSINWMPLSAGSGGVTSVNTRTGALTLVGTDIPVFGGSGSSHAPGAVPDPGPTAGTTRFLREDGTFAVPPSSSGMSNPMTAVGDIIVGSTVTGGVAAPARLGAGSAGQVLTSNGAGAAPSWQAGGSGGSGAAPTRRGSTWSGAITGTSVSLSLPAGSAAGDLCVLIGTGGNATNPTSMTGWTLLLRSGDYWASTVFYKTLTSSDISAGHIAVTIGGSFINYAMMSVYASGAYVAALGWSELTFDSLSMNLPVTLGLSPRVGKVDANANMDWMIMVSCRGVNSSQTMTNNGSSSSVGSTTNSNGSGAAWNANFGSYLPVAVTSNGGSSNSSLANVIVGILD